MKKTVFFLAIGILLTTFALVLRNKPPTTSKVSVVASFYPLAEFASKVGGDLVTVTNLTPAGSEPHDFEPAPKDLVALQNANVFIYNGAGFEVWLQKIRPSLNTQTIEVNSSDGISLLEKSLEKAEDEDEHAGTKDPHLWLDPVLASAQVENIKKGLMQADPEHADVFERNATAYQQELATLDQDFVKGLSSCSIREIVTSHNAFAYLAKRYGISVQSISGFSPDEEPSPKKLSEVVQFSRDHNVAYIFFETLVSPKLAETIAKETRAKTIVFNPIEGLSAEELSQGKSYLSIQRENLQALRTALSCQ